MDLSTKYLGLKLKNPIIVGSSGLTGTVKGVKKLADNGAAAIVLKSLFQEEIFFESDDVIRKMKKEHPDVQYFDYDGKKNPIEFYGYKVREDNLKRYTTLIRDCKSGVHIPIIASVNCFYDSLEWVLFARELEQAGADALELNMFFPPTDFSANRQGKETIYFETIDKISKEISIPISMKISYYFTDLGPMIKALSETDIKGLVLFNRFFSPDFDIQKLEVKPSFVFSAPSELAQSLRWIAIMANKVSCDLAASTGIHDGEAVIKEILAGADVVQVVSALYIHGPGHIQSMLDDLKSWMKSHGFGSISDFKGKLSQEASKDPKLYERTQFMKYFAGKSNVIS
ncbi:MAG: dihydroorotate dehydrogenase-like protein [Proteobacteria bacterium]|nr:dihydroorotate dehydrogenase-like protein [Pseudomonadota bacterium]